MNRIPITGLLLCLAVLTAGCGNGVLKNPLARHAQVFAPVGDVLYLAHTRRIAPVGVARSPLVPDTLIKWSVQELFHQAQLTGVRVEVKDQLVTLRGRVDSGFEADDAELLARSVHGVLRVENAIRF